MPVEGQRPLVVVQSDVLAAGITLDMAQSLQNMGLARRIVGGMKHFPCRRVTALRLRQLSFPVGQCPQPCQDRSLLPLVAARSEENARLGKSLARGVVMSSLHLQIAQRGQRIGLTDGILVFVIKHARPAVGFARARGLASQPEAFGLVKRMFAFVVCHSLDPIFRKSSLDSVSLYGYHVNNARKYAWFRTSSG